ncbi:hypothetical protein IC582_007644 [Cucumis melo]|uniref:Uncharacterized protein n=1 Tax=Cucumis melo TaxID=3656 RepID=A0A9I9E902_CUCME
MSRFPKARVILTPNNSVSSEIKRSQLRAKHGFLIIARTPLLAVNTHSTSAESLPLHGHQNHIPSYLHSSPVSAFSPPPLSPPSVSKLENFFCFGRKYFNAILFIKDRGRKYCLEFAFIFNSLLFDGFFFPYR